MTTETRISRCAAPLLAGLAVLLLVTPPVAQAKKGGNAFDLYKKGVSLAKEGKFEEAIKLFEKARNKGAPPEVLINLGKCHLGLGHTYTAAQFYLEYLEEPDAQHADKVEEIVEKLRVEPSTLTLDSDPAGAAVTEVRDDGTENEIGSTPLEYKLDAGEVTLVLVLEGHEEKRIDIEAGFGKPYDLDVELTAVEPAAAGPDEDGAGVDDASMDTWTGDGDEDGSVDAGLVDETPARFPMLGLALEIGGGASLFTHQAVRDVDFQAGGHISVGIAYHLSHGTDSGFSVGALFDMRSYTLEGDTDWEPREWKSFLMHILAVPAYQIRLHRRLALQASLPLGIALIVPRSKLAENDFVNLVGGYIVNGHASLFDLGAAVALRIAVVSGLYITVEPVHMHVLVPLRKWENGTKALVDLDVGARVGFEF